MKTTPTLAYQIPRPMSVTLLEGEFDLRTRPMTNHLLREILEDLRSPFLARELDDDEWVRIRNTLCQRFEEHRPEVKYSFNLFHFEQPRKHQRPRAGARALLAWEVGFQFERFQTGWLQASETTLREFERLETPDECLQFAKHWGKLGPEHDRCYFWLVQDVEESVRLQVRDRLGSAGLVLRLYSEQQTAQSFITWYPDESLPITGEPVAAWLWHAARLRTWRQLLKIVSRSVGSKTRWDQLRNLLSQSTDSWSEGEATVVHDLAQVHRPASERDLETIDQVEPWSYALHQEGGALGFAAPAFENLRVNMDPESRRIDARSIQGFIELAIRKTLQGHITIVPKIGRASQETVECDSLLTWLYLEFARQHTDELGLARTHYVQCVVCGDETAESPQVRGRKRVCSPRCQKRLDRLGEEQARMTYRQKGPVQ